MSWRCHRNETKSDWTGDRGYQTQLPLTLLWLSVRELATTSLMPQQIWNLLTNNLTVNDFKLSVLYALHETVLNIVQTVVTIVLTIYSTALFAYYETIIIHIDAVSKAIDGVGRGQCNDDFGTHARFSMWHTPVQWKKWRIWNNPFWKKTFEVKWNESQLYAFPISSMQWHSQPCSNKVNASEMR